MKQSDHDNTSNLVHLETMLYHAHLLTPCDINGPTLGQQQQLIDTCKQLCTLLQARIERALTEQDTN